MLQYILFFSFVETASAGQCALVFNLTARCSVPKAGRDTEIRKGLQACFAKVILNRNGEQVTAIPSYASGSEKYNVSCGAIDLTCSEKAEQFPNACSVFFSVTAEWTNGPSFNRRTFDYGVGLYSYSAFQDNRSQRILDAWFAMKDDGLCKAQVSFYEKQHISAGDCLGFIPDISGPTCDPPRPPALPQGLYPQLPTVGPTGFPSTRCSATLAPTQAPYQPSVKNDGSWSPAFRIFWTLVGLVALAVGLYFRRKRRIREEESLRGDLQAS